MQDTATMMVFMGLISGLPLGIAARLGRFCSIGAIEDLVYGGRYYRALMWPTAIGWSLIGVAALMLLGLFDLERAVYLQRAPNYGAHIVGGLIFGYGMALAGMCGFTALSRIGHGDMRALIVVIFIGIGAYMASSGLLSGLRVSMFDYELATDNSSSLALSAEAAFGWRAELLLIAIGAPLILLPLLRKNFRNSRYPLWGLVVAIGIVLGWGGSYWATTSTLSELPAVSHTFSLPLGEGLLYTMLSSGMAPSFGIGSALGVVIGAFIGVAIKGEFRWEACDDARELSRNMIGALLMGIGAVIAFGCSIGQGISAMALLYAGAPVTLISIGIGAYVGLKYLIEG